MTPPDLLERATRALRDTTENNPERTPEQLERALQRLERERRPRPRARRGWHVWAWALASTFVGVGAWANATGRVSWFDFTPAPVEPVAAPNTPSEPRPSKREAIAPEAALAPPLPAPPAPETAAEKPRKAARRAPPAPVEAPAAPVAEAPAAGSPAAPHPDPADTLYRAAHTAHFTRADYAAALKAWDEYLGAAGPGHRWLLEARFNRAIALYRLQQFPAAREALTPFARGDYGGYRRSEAQRLMDALVDRD